MRTAPSYPLEYHESLRLETLHDVAGVRRVHELAPADVDPDVRFAVEEHEVAGLELILDMCVPAFQSEPV